LLFDCLVEIVEYKRQRVLIHYLGTAICSKYLLHDLIQEVVAEVPHCNCSRFSNQILGHREEASTLEVAEDEVSFKDGDYQKELYDERNEVSGVLLMHLILAGPLSLLLSPSLSIIFALAFGTLNFLVFKLVLFDFLDVLLSHVLLVMHCVEE
jgi:hypothetical protein